MLGGFRSHALDDLERFLHMLYVVSKQKDCSPSDVLIAFTETIAGAWPEAHLFLKHRALDGDETAETILEILSEQITNNVH